MELVISIFTESTDVPGELQGLLVVLTQSFGELIKPFMSGGNQLILIKAVAGCANGKFSVLTWKGGGYSTVNRQGCPCGRSEGRGKEDHCIPYMVGKDLGFEEVSFAVVFFESFRVKVS